MKVLEIKGKLVTAKHKVLNLLKMMSGLGNEASDVSSPNPLFGEVPYEQVTFLKNYALEAELKKAEAVLYWQRWLDRAR